MLNFRLIPPRFALSGGWQDIDDDAVFLRKQKVGAVLDLQFTPADDPPVAFLHETLEELGILYHHIPMWDGGPPQDWKTIFMKGVGVIEAWRDQTDKRILVKCAVGNSRSPAMLSAYLCEQKLAADYYEAIGYIRQAEGAYTLIPTGPVEEFVHTLRGMYGPQEGEEERKSSFSI